MMVSRRRQVKPRFDLAISGCAAATPGGGIGKFSTGHGLLGRFAPPAE